MIEYSSVGFKAFEDRLVQEAGKFHIDVDDVIKMEQNKEIFIIFRLEGGFFKKLKMFRKIPKILLSLLVIAPAGYKYKACYLLGSHRKPQIFTQ